MAGHVVKVSVTADTRKAKRAFEQFARTSGLESLADNAKKAAQAAALAVGGLAAAAIAAAPKLISLGSDLEQSIGGVDAVFKDSATQIHAWATSAANDVGLAANEYNELATLIGAQLKNAGTPMTELASKTNDLIGVGADLAAQFGGSTSDAVAALSSALKGERDPIERYGVSLRQAAIDAKAAELGFEKVNGSFDQEAQAAATLALIMEQTTDAHGAFARESDTVAHKIQVLKAQAENLATGLGVALLPVVAATTDWISTHLLPAAEQFSQWITSTGIPTAQALAQTFAANILPILKALAASFHTHLLPAIRSFIDFTTGTLLPALSGLPTVLQDWGPAIATAVGVIMAFIEGFKAFQRITAIINAAKVAWAALSAVLAANPIILIAAAVAALAAGLVYAYQHSETFRNVVNDGFERIKTAALGLWEALQTAWQTIGVPLSNFIISVFQGVAANWDAIWNGIVTTLTGVWTIIEGVVTGALTIIQGIIQVITSAISGDWKGVWEGIKTILTGVWTIIEGVVTGALDIVRGYMQTMMATISGAWSGAWDAVSSTVTSAWSSITSGIRSGISNAITAVALLPGRILSALGNLGSLLIGAGRSLIQGFIDGIRSMIGSVRDTLTSLTASLTSWKGPEDLDKRILTPAGEYVIEGFITGLESRYGAVRRSLQGLTGIIADTTVPALAPPNISGSSATSGVQVTINVTGGLASGPEIGREVERALNQWWAVSGKRGLIL